MKQSSSDINGPHQWAKVFDDNYFPANLNNRMLSDTCYWKMDWQAPDGETTKQERGMHPIGLRAVFPALLVLHRGISGKTDLKASQFLMNVRKHPNLNAISLKEMIPNSSSQTAQDGHIDDHVYEQFNFSKKAHLPDRSQKLKMVDTLIEYIVLKAELDRSYHNEFKQALDEDYFEISEIVISLYKIYEHAVLKRDEGIERTTVFSDSLKNIRFSDHSGVGSKIEDLHRDMSSNERPSRIIGIIGPRYCGKTKMLLQVLSKYSLYPNKVMYSPAQLFKIDGDDAILPTLGLSCRHKTYPEIVRKVLEFLRGAHMGNVDPVMNDLAEQVIEIEHLSKKYPAIYVFPSLDCFGGNPAENTIKDGGLFRLLGTLCKSNKSNRILFSSCEPLTSYGDAGSLFPKGWILEKHVDEPVLTDLLKFFKDPKRGDIDQLLEFDDENLPIPGYINILLATTLRLETDAGEINQLITETRELATKLKSAEFIEKAKIESKMTIIIWSRLSQLYASARGLRWLLVLLAASEDGMSLTSAKDLLSQIFKTNDSGFLEKTIAELEEFITDTDGLLVHKVEDSDVSKPEVFPSELAENEEAGSKGYFTRFVMDGPLSESLINFVSQDRRAVFRKAMFSISQLARKRSKQIKLSIKEVYGTDKRHLNRDIQAYKRLLSSLSRSELSKTDEQLEAKARTNTESKTTINPALLSPKLMSPLLESSIFGSNTILKNAASNRTAYRYAYLRIFRKDIDRNNRLTMILDEDSLKLELLICLFDGIGSYFSMDQHYQLPDEIPPHVLNSFSKKEICEILTSISLSAYFSNRYDLVFGAAKLSQQLLPAALNDKEKEPLNASDITELKGLMPHLIRVWCVELDTLLIAPPTDNKKGIEHWSLLDTRINEIEALLDHNKKEPCHKVCYQRLLFQKTRLQYYQVEQADIVQIAETCKANASQINGYNAKSVGGMSGRNIRVLIKSLLGDPALFCMPKDLNIKLETAIELSHMNLARLSRYGGGDRIGTLVDEAMISFLSENYDDALYYIDLADNSLNYPKISHALRADSLWHHAQILFLTCTLTDEKCSSLNVPKDKLLSRAKDKTEELLRWSSNKYPLYQALGHFLMAKIIIQDFNMENRAQAAKHLKQCSKISRSLGARKIELYCDEFINRL